MVHFVGAGPGAADLITIRGRKFLEECDVLIYAGSLVNPELINYCKKDCEVHNSAYLNLEQVIDIMINKICTSAYVCLDEYFPHHKK